MKHYEKEIVLDGHNVDVASVVAVARSGAVIRLAAKTNRGVEESAKLLQGALDRGSVIYGVNTGFGGSADTRTKKVEELQAALIRELHGGILSKPSQRGRGSSDTLPAHDADSTACMPEAWVRASMLVRINSLSGGHSGVRPILIKNLVELLRRNIIPRIPLRGSISASGDLMPLSYIGGALEGKKSITVWAGSGSNRCVMSAAEALSKTALDPIKLGPKEGLAIINGTAVSAGVGALAINDANKLSILSQALTAMSVEALQGTTESFDPFFDAVRPHPGQREAARNIRKFLSGSGLAQDKDGSAAGSLRQDRYSIRTAPQWLGPMLEDLELATRQVTIECNSVTDNPLMDIDPEYLENTRILHGGNFQARAITSAMEKTRLALQTMGQMHFAQCTEIIDPKMNYGLPPSVVADEPSESFLFKPIDIAIAALQSELGFLANPAGSHVQSAEMGNQSLNSLALISARYTHVALDVLSQLMSYHLLVLCQALDLRAMHFKFLEDFRPTFDDIISNNFGSIVRSKSTENRPRKRTWDEIELPLPMSTQSGPATNGCSTAERDISDLSAVEMPESPLKMSEAATKFTKDGSPVESLETLQTLLWTGFKTQLNQTTTVDSTERFAAIFRSLLPTIIDFAPPESSPRILEAMQKWTEAATSAASAFCNNRDAYHASPDASPHLGKVSRQMYKFVREDLNVPFLRSSQLRHKHDTSVNGITSKHQNGDLEGSREEQSGLTTGELATTIYEAIREGRLCEPVMNCLAEMENSV